MIASSYDGGIFLPFQIVGFIVEHPLIGLIAAVAVVTIVFRWLNR
jgi:hypothetical protein